MKPAAMTMDEPLTNLPEARDCGGDDPAPPVGPGGQWALLVEDLSVTFPNGNGGLKAVRDLTFAVAPQSFVCVLGPSGSGKSTLLRAIAGLVPPTRGEISFPAFPRRPRIGYVFQDANLMPWRTVMDNVTLPLELQHIPAEQTRARARELISLTGLEGFEDEWPHNLSGGMAQRVAIARALIQDPDLLLLDEPFGALDALTRERMGSELLRIWQIRRKTVLMVTHSISEALLLSDRVLVFTPRPGRLCLDLPVDLPRPRSDDMRYTPEFGQLAQRLMAAIGL
ncbi:MAG TPA: ABC transporter ATP-binding protein [Anaerolineaceae bacterium]|nr:ABC transporter ATP-binding protein [Anaerolineaceae bacterium]